MTSVWTVEEGEYSGYCVLAIFGTEEQAKTFCEHREQASYREWTLDTWTTEQATFRFEFDMSGNIIAEHETAKTDSPSDAIAQGRHGRDEIVIEVHRGPRERAVKVASERYARLRAFLDEATERTDKALPEVDEHLRTMTSLLVAQVLAGILPAPDPPLCGFDEYVLKVLRLR